MGRRNVMGFTLVEIIVVIAIIGVLASILVPSLIGYVRKAKKAADIASAKTIYQDIYTMILTDDDASASFHNILNSSGKNERWVAKEPGTSDTYGLIAVAQLSGVNHARSGREYYIWRATQTESQPFVKYLNDFNGYTDALSKKKETPARMQLHDKNPNGDHLDQWVICMRKDNGEVEIWAADSSLSWNSTAKGYLVYRLWPNPDPGYGS